MTKLEIINETVKYYTEDPSRRGIDIESGDCKYITNDGCMCAVGRCMINPDEFINFLGDVGSVCKNVTGNNEALFISFKPVSDTTNIDNILKEEYRGHELKFWYDLQTFHDICTYWQSNSVISEQTRQDAIEKLIKKYS